MSCKYHEYEWCPGKPSPDLELVFYYEVDESVCGVMNLIAFEEAEV